MSIIGLILFLLIIIVLIFVHELGHFLAAKWTGMKVEEFSIGFFEPKIYSKKIGETEYSIRAFLLGGYVKILGENGNSEGSSDPRAFGNKPWLSQFVVLIAGVFMNMFFAYILFVYLSFGSTIVATDDPDWKGRVSNERIMVVDVMRDSPASLAGIAPGAQIIKIVSRGEVAPLNTATSAVSFIERHNNDAISITYKNAKAKNEETTTLASVYGLTPDRKIVGITLEKVGDVNIGPVEAFIIGFKKLKLYTVMTFDGLKQLFVDVFDGKNVLTSLAGPIGIASLVGSAQKVGIASVVLLSAFLSINLAVINILPFPALDGGQIVKVTIESLLRRKLPIAYTTWLNGIGFLLLVSLLLVVSIHDILNLIN